jgi:hypothetical protein
MGESFPCRLALYFWRTVNSRGEPSLLHHGLQGPKWINHLRGVTMNQWIITLAASALTFAAASGFAADAVKKQEVLTAEQKTEIRDRVERLKAERAKADQAKATTPASTSPAPAKKAPAKV